MSRLIASELATRLGRQAEAVCRHYLPAGRKTGRYWIVGDVHNSPGRSMFVRLTGPESGKGSAGRWQDYVAASVMLRSCATTRPRQHLSTFTQHNLLQRRCA